MEARREWDGICKILKGKEHQEFYKNPVSAKLCFKNKGEINTFHDKTENLLLPNLPYKKY